MTARGRALWPAQAGEPWLVAGACLVLRAASLVRVALSDDEAIYAVVAREMLDGRRLYRDVVDHKPPLIYLVYAATQALGGPRGGMLLLHALTIAVVAATALLLRRLVQTCAPPVHARAPLAAALLYAVFTTTLLPFDGLAANCELFMMLPLTGSVLLFWRGATGARTGALFAAGALLALAALFKYQAGVQLPLYGVSLLLLHGRRWPRSLLGMGALLAGAATVLAAALAVMQRAGCLAAAWFWFRFNAGYIQTGFHPWDTLRRAGVRVTFVAAGAAFLWTLGLSAMVRAGKHGRGLDLPRFAALWAAVSALAVGTGGRFFGHYFHQLTAPLAVLAAPAATELWCRRRGLVAAAVGDPAAAFLLLGLFQHPIFAAVLSAAGKASPDYAGMAALVQAHARPGDRLLVWGNLPVLHFLDQHPLGTRFVFSNYLTGLSPATPSQSDPAVDASANIVPESWPLFEADLAERKPRLLLDTSPGDLAAYGKFPPSKFPRLQAVLERDYHPVACAAGARLFLRRETRAE